MTNKNIDTPIYLNPTLIIQALIGLKNIRVISYQRQKRFIVLAIELLNISKQCGTCGMRAFIKDRPVAHYTDLPAFGVRVVLKWHKHRLKCVNTKCKVKSWTVTDHRIAAKNCLLTTRCAKWATEQVGRGRAVSDVARELGCDWHTINNVVTLYGEALLKADTKRVTHSTAIGLDETSFVKRSNAFQREYVTTVADVEHHQIIDILPTRDYREVAAWVHTQSNSWKQKIRYGALDMSAAYAAVYSVTLPNAKQVVDAFHLVQLANRKLDQIRRRVQQQNKGHRGRKNDPLYRIRRSLLKGEEKLSDEAAVRLESLLLLGDPDGEVAIAYRVKERIRQFYQCLNLEEARMMLTEVIEHCQKKVMPKELQQFARTLKKWFEKICNYHLARISNGPTEALNNLIKRVKRVGYGFTNFHNYRIRALLYAGRPNWRILGSIVVT